MILHLFQNSYENNFFLSASQYLSPFTLFRCSYNGVICYNLFGVCKTVTLGFILSNIIIIFLISDLAFYSQLLLYKLQSLFQLPLFSTVLYWALVIFLN